MQSGELLQDLRQKTGRRRRDRGYGDFAGMTNAETPREKTQFSNSHTSRRSIGSRRDRRWLPSPRRVIRSKRVTPSAAFSALIRRLTVGCVILNLPPPGGSFWRPRPPKRLASLFGGPRCRNLPPGGGAAQHDAADRQPPDQGAGSRARRHPFGTDHAPGEGNQHRSRARSDAAAAGVRVRELRLFTGRFRRSSSRRSHHRLDRDGGVQFSAAGVEEVHHAASGHPVPHRGFVGGGGA